MHTNTGQIETLILAVVNLHWTSIAIVIAKVGAAHARNGITLTEERIKDIASHVYQMIDNGRLELRGSRELWAEAEVRLTAPHNNA